VTPHDGLADELAGAVMRLARRNEALEDFAALVAHELKTPLNAALVAPDPSIWLRQALGLVDTLLECARSEASVTTATAVGDCVQRAVNDLALGDLVITSELTTSLPVPPEPLRVILRNLIANAVAAGAHHVHVSSARSAGSWRLHVEDDGAGLGDNGGYVAGSGLGLGLCRRIASRFEGALELAPRPIRGTRATLVLEGSGS
jgi:signal transduction histidine kinase